MTQTNRDELFVELVEALREISMWHTKPQPEWMTDRQVLMMAENRARVLLSKIEPETPKPPTQRKASRGMATYCDEACTDEKCSENHERRFVDPKRGSAVSKTILCLDFDGVIHSYASGWKGPSEIPDDPVPGALVAIIGYLRDGFEVAIFSSRSKSFWGRIAMKQWLRRHLREHFWKIDLEHPEAPWTGLDIDELHDNAARDIVRKIKWPWFKPAAFITIDDRALTFDGTWPHAETIRSFKPWNKRSNHNPENKPESLPPPTRIRRRIDAACSSPSFLPCLHSHAHSRAIPRRRCCSCLAARQIPTSIQTLR